MRVAVVGAGIAGLSTAWALAKRGHSVTLFEQGGAIPNPLSASGDEHRMIRRAYGRQDGYARLMSEAFAAWDEMWADIGQSHFAPTGILTISQTPGDFGEGFRDGLDRTGFAYDLFEGREAAERYPFLEGAAIRYAFLSAEGGVLFCRRIARDLLGWLAATGVTLRPQTPVRSVDAEGGRLTTAGGEVFDADRIVVTAGAWILGLFPELGGSLKTYRTAVAYLDPPADLRFAWENAPAILDIGGRSDGYVIPPVDGTGLKIGAGVHKRPAGPDEDRSPASGEGESLRGLFSPPLARIGEYQVVKVVTCAYTFTADESFFAAERGRALIVSACSGHGYKFGAAVGRRTAEALETGDFARYLGWLRGRPREAGGGIGRCTEDRQMAAEPLRPRDWSSHPPFVYPAYKSTLLRGPKRPLVPIRHTLSELTGPVYGHSHVGPLDHDLTQNAAKNGQPLGERIIVTGRVVDESGRPVRDTLIEIWQANAAGRYVHRTDQHEAPLDPNFLGGGRAVTDERGRYRFHTIKPGAYPWGNHFNAWRPSHIHLSLFGSSIAARLVTQMYFPGDSLHALDPIFQSAPPPARERLVANFSLDVTEPGFALGYTFDIVLRGPVATPMEPER